MIPFLRHFPNGRTAQETITRPPKVERMAQRFCRAGGRYLITIHPSGEVELVAAMPVAMGQVDCFATATCFNDPVLPEAIDQLVRDSLKELERRERVH